MLSIFNGVRDITMLSVTVRLCLAVLCGGMIGLERAFKRRPAGFRMLYTDRNRLTQVLTNLLTNAIKHTEEGYIRFGYNLTDSEVCFFVQDTGEGIPQEQLDHIFSRFVQLDDWSKGVGLGLAICKGLLEKMGGTISVTSKVGEGSVFYVKLQRR